MCGILGTVSKNEINRQRFSNSLLNLKHRGPDDIQTYFKGEIAFGHTRLSIIDLSDNGKQPMLSSDQNYVIVFNGEIYNYTELKNDLLPKYAFRSNSDTEVLLNAYIEYGKDVLQKIDGIFAFAIYNHSDKSLFIARDHAGIKPFYFSKTKDYISFSSEVKPLLPLIENNSVDQASMVKFLTHGSVQEPDTIYEAVKCLPAGSYGFYKDCKLQIHNYYGYSYTPKTGSNNNEIYKQTNLLLHNSVKSQLISDAPIGIFLSGGLDSSILTAIASKYRDNLTTFSLTFNGDNNAKARQKLISEKYKTTHISKEIDKNEFLSNAQDFLKCMDQPTVDGFNVYLVSKLAKEAGFKVALSGIGSDEIFFGYPTFRRAKYLKYLQNLQLNFISKLVKSKYQKLDYLSLDDNYGIYLSNRAIFSLKEISMHTGISVEDIIFNYKIGVENDIELKDSMSFYESSFYMKNQLLKDADVYGMANQVEIRVPFTSQPLVDYVNKTPVSIKSNKDFEKSLLVNSMKNALPNTIYKQAKMGFELPFKNWLKEEFNEDFKDNQPWAKQWSLIILKNFM